MGLDVTVRAIAVTEPGGPEVLSFTEVPDPIPGPNEVVIEVAAAALNRADVLQRQGHYPPPPGASEILGLECAGQISQLGQAVTGWRLGDTVCALLPGGGYAEKVAIDASQLLPVPPGVSVEEAAGLPEATCTVWSNVFSLARLSPGEILLVHGGSGGIGTMALQLGKAYGAHVFCTASPSKAAICQALGADRVIDYHSEDFPTVVRETTNGADVILDTVGAAYLSPNLEALTNGGRLVIIGLQRGRTADVDLRTLLNKRATITGTTLRSRPLPEKAQIITEVREHVWPLMESGRVRPVIDRAFALPDAAEAHAYLEKGQHIGKVLLVR